MANIVCWNDHFFSFQLHGLHLVCFARSRYFTSLINPLWSHCWAPWFCEEPSKWLAKLKTNYFNFSICEKWEELLDSVSITVFHFLSLAFSYLAINKIAHPDSEGDYQIIPEPLYIFTFLLLQSACNIGFEPLFETFLTFQHPR